MNIMELGALGEFVAAIVVVATLAYLVTQVRQNNRQLKDTATNALISEMNGLLLLIAENPDVAALLVQDGAEELDPIGQLRYQMLFEHILSTYWGMHSRILNQTSNYDAVFLESQIATRLGGLPRVTEMWQQSRINFPQDFQDFIEKSLP